MSLFECVPNLSEGRSEEAVDLLCAAAESGGAALLHRTSDADHHRTVLTLAGRADDIERSALALAEAAIQHLDLRDHRGVHPRIGVLDVVPMIPLKEASMDEAVALADRVAAKAARRWRLPIVLYGSAARAAHRRRLAAWRRGGLEALATRLHEPRWQPDYGPAALHPSAGAMALGARPVLVAYNVVLRSHDLGLARRISTEIRESSGGLAGVQALGVELPSRGLVQVSMNLVDLQQATPGSVFHAVHEAAARNGVEVEGSEIVGMVPEAALADSDPAELRLEGFSDEQILERRLRAKGLLS